MYWIKQQNLWRRSLVRIRYHEDTHSIMFRYHSCSICNVKQTESFALRIWASYARETQSGIFFGSPADRVSSISWVNKFSMYYVKKCCTGAFIKFFFMRFARVNLCTAFGTFRVDWRWWCCLRGKQRLFFFCLRVDQQFSIYCTRWCFMLQFYLYIVQIDSVNWNVK